MSNMTLSELQQVKMSLTECGPNVEDFNWGPSYDFAMQRRTQALTIIENAIQQKLKAAT
jgi:hypothetical protein